MMYATRRYFMTLTYDVIYSNQVKLGVPSQRESINHPMKVNLDEVAKVFPYGRLLPMEVVIGGLSFNTGRIVRELGDEDDLAVCVLQHVFRLAMIME